MQTKTMKANEKRDAFPHRNITSRDLLDKSQTQTVGINITIGCDNITWKSRYIK